jgi:hypothetical protein
MYKPNGEERMTEQEERQFLEARALRRLERARAATSVAEVLGTTLYANLLHADPREELVAASFSHQF